jgi:hypothetical protein
VKTKYAKATRNIPILNDQKEFLFAIQFTQLFKKLGRSKDISFCIDVTKKVGVSLINLDLESTDIRLCLQGGNKV